MHQDLAQVAVTALANPIELRLAACRVLPRHQAHPSGELATLLEGGSVADRGYDRSCDQRSDPGICRNLRQAASLEAIRSTSSFISTI
jgi:hypothetical protein